MEIIGLSKGKKEGQKKGEQGDDPNGFTASFSPTRRYF